MRKPAISPAMALFPLRLFLGVTFVYAGVQKLSDPGFLHAGASTYIGTQLEGFANGTPGGFVLHTFALPFPEVAGVGVALVEILVGLLVTAGFFTRPAAAVGMGLNFLLFLTASWHTTPYFLGPDIVFTFAWLPFVLVGSEGQPALENLVRRPSPALARRISLNPEALERMDEGAAARSTRRALLLEFGGAAIAIAGIAALFKGAYTAPPTLAAGTKRGAGGAGNAGAAHGGGGGAGAQGAAKGSSKLPAGAVKLGPGNRVPAGSAATYSDPSTGAPDILIRDEEGGLKAFSAVCTHAGCTVGYEGGTIVCPCHGGEYSAETGEVIAGPPPEGLAPKKVVESGGQIYAVPS
jgi:thiosulfate dehydrogenase [quinone] large subunit